MVRPLSLRTLVALANDPPAPLASTVTVTLNVQLDPAAKIPPVKVSDDVPDRLDPAPQRPAAGRLDTVDPVIVPPILSRNSRLLRPTPPTGLSMV